MTITYGVAETIGHRREMEDAHSIWQEERLHIFGAEVYDGHAGSRAAMLAAERLSRHFLDRVKAEPEPTAEDVFTAEALREAYLVTDRYIVEQDTESGTAAATLYLLGDRFLAANAGDVRIVVGNGSRAVSLTVDHKPALPEEKARIEALGGSVDRKSVV
jgi:serine/threonine protein phosphatase PrpC